MTDWKFELIQAALAAATSALLIFFEPSAVIFAAALIFSTLHAMSHSSLEPAIPWHWLILAAAAGFFALQTPALAIIFLAAYAAMRFFIALIRFDETQEILRRSQNLREIHEAELKNLRRDSESNLRNAIGELKLQHLRDKFSLRAEFYEKLLRKKNEPSNDDPPK